MAPPNPPLPPAPGGAPAAPAEDGFRHLVEQFADVKIIRYRVAGFEALSPAQKKLLYLLSMAALAGRDIVYDQNYKHGLTVRKTLEAIVESGLAEGPEGEEVWLYLKRVWTANGIHHHASGRKFRPGFSPQLLARLLDRVDPRSLPLGDGETPAMLAARLTPILFDPDLDPLRVNKAPGADPVAESANNYYEGVTQEEVEAYYRPRLDAAAREPVSHGLNSKLVKEQGEIVEKVWKVGGMYSPAIERIVYWLEQAVAVAETPEQEKALRRLIAYYRSGDLRTFNEYNVAWLADTASTVDLINGFIEVYGDALGMRGAYESVVSIRDPQATARIATLARHASWFEAQAPFLPEHKRAEVQGMVGNVISVVMAAGDASPCAPIGINLPNAGWIRQQHGSKSVLLGNIADAVHEARRGSGLMEEFAYDARERELYRRYDDLASRLRTEMHEVLGHASGRLEPGVGTLKETLKQYALTVEEARADLVALYFLMDEKLIELGVMDSLDVGRIAYNDYVTNGLLRQLRRIAPGENLEEDHQRNRQLVASWTYDHGRAENVIEKKRKAGKTYFVVNDHGKLRALFGRLLREVQRIKSQGDFAAAQELVETWGVRVDPELHAEVLARTRNLQLAPYSGFINPRLVPVEVDGEIVDVRIEYPDDFARQQLEYSREHSFLAP